MRIEFSFTVKNCHFVPNICNYGKDHELNNLNVIILFRERGSKYSLALLWTGSPFQKKRWLVEDFC